MKWELAGLWVAAYLIGSLPFGLWIAAVKGVDLRAAGSGNIGATNVWRSVGRGPAILTLLMDTMKGFLPALAGGMLFLEQYSPENALVVGTGAVVGHCASFLLRFRGGRGVATLLGVSVATSPDVAGVCLLVWLALFVPTRYVSLSSIVAILPSAPLAFFFGYSSLIGYVYLGVTFLLIFNHRPNIRRLIQGEEPKLGQRSKRKE